MRGKAIVPAIRFAGFTDAWERRKLAEIAGRTYGGGTPKTNIMEYWDGYIPWIQSSNLMEHELFNVDIQKHITDDGLNKSAAQLVPPNSVAVVSHVGVGKLVLMPLSYTTSQDFISLSELKADPIFTCYSVYKRLQNDLHIVQGSAIKGITKDDLLSKEIMLPSESEQIKIGEYFRHLDRLITLHQRKYSRLCNIKKSMLERMFPKEGASVPEIRFAGFTDAWERRKLGELTTEFIEYITLSSELPLLTSSRAGLMYQNEYRGNLTTDSKETLFSVVPLGACTYRHMSDDDIFHLNINILEKGLVSREYPVFIATGENDLNFIVQHLNSDSKFRAFCAEQKKGGTRTRLYYKTLCEFSVMVPKSAEQNKISSLLLGIDHLITLHQRKLERLQNIKKSCLEKMFV